MILRLLTSMSALTALAGSTAALAAAGWAPLHASHFDGRSPDTKDAALAAQKLRHLAGHVRGAQRAVLDGRSPDTRDAAAATRTTTSPVIIVSANSFDWTDAGIGAAAGFGLVAMLGAGLTAARKPGRSGRPDQTSPTATRRFRTEEP
jgi:hypothetical protein